jgi:hypothetical protein
LRDGANELVTTNYNSIKLGKILTDFCCGVPVLQVRVKVVRLPTTTESPLLLVSAVESTPVALEESVQAVSPTLLLQVTETLPPRYTRLGVTLSCKPVWLTMVVQVLAPAVACCWPLGQLHSGYVLILSPLGQESATQVLLPLG